MRIAVLVVLLGAVTGAALWLLQPLRPAQLPWHDVGIERMGTPALDFGDERIRTMLSAVARHSRPAITGGFAASCGTSSTWPETYVLFRRGEAPTIRPRRTTITLSAGGGQSVHERIDPVRWLVASHLRRGIDAGDADAFRDLLLDNGFGDAPSPLPSTRSCDSEFVSLESCVAGRYYAAVLGCASDGPPTASLEPLADAIESFVLRGEPDPLQ